VPIGGGHGAEVVNIHTKLEARPLPNRSCAPVVIVAVNWAPVVPRPGGVGVKVAIWAAAL